MSKKQKKSSKSKSKSKSKSVLESDNVYHGFNIHNPFKRKIPRKIKWRSNNYKLLSNPDLELLPLIQQSMDKKCTNEGHINGILGIIERSNATIIKEGSGDFVIDCTIVIDKICLQPPTGSYITAKIEQINPKLLMAKAGPIIIIVSLETSDIDLESQQLPDNPIGTYVLLKINASAFHKNDTNINCYASFADVEHSDTWKMVYNKIFEDNNSLN
tara:strand:+ start:8614 stop:9258 length:645 start_codon:yes stop_codon:yes gene_type:complete